MFERSPDLNTDAEYLLQSDQGSQALLIEVLVTETYPGLFWLALALLDDPAAARQATIRAVTQALAHTYQYRPGRGVQPWLAGFLLQAILNERDRLSPPSPTLPPEWGKGAPPSPRMGEGGRGEGVTQTILDLYATLDLPSRAVVLLRYLFGWSPVEIAQVEGLTTGLPARLMDTERRFGAVLSSVGSDQPDLEQVVGRCLEYRWPSPSITEEQLEQVIGEVETLAALQTARRRRLTLLKEILLVGVTILVVIAAFWGANTLVPPEPTPTPYQVPATPVGPAPTPMWVDNVAYVVQTGDTLEEVAARAGTSPLEIRRINAMTETQSIYPGMPVWVPVPEFARGSDASIAPTPAPLSASGPAGPHERLTIRSTTHAVSRRIAESGDYWRTLWADLQMASYAMVHAGSSSAGGEASAYRMQVWLWPPNRSLELYNDLSSFPAFRHIILNGRNYTSAGPYSNSYLAPDWLHAPDVLLQSPLLRGMFFPGVLLASQLKVSGLERVAGLPCLVVEYRAQGDQDPFHLRLWVDTATGVILRRQLFEPVTERLLSDIIVTEIAYDVDIPNELFDPRRHWAGGFATDWQGRAIPPTYIEPTPTWALPKTP